MEGGARGLEVTDTSADTVLPHLTTDNPICTGEPTGEPAFNAQVEKYILKIIFNILFMIKTNIKLISASIF